ncbi:MAG: carboxypeptidase-like regulatory domain-containing protein [Terriglobia bacterium]
MKICSILIQVSVMTFLCAVVPGSIFGQLGMATLGGTVTDASGAVVPNAQVALRSATRNEQRNGMTNSVGQYVFSAVLPGTYQLSVTAAGFRAKTITGVILTSGQGSTLNVNLSVSSTTQRVTVASAPPLLQTTTATVGSVVGAQQFESLPMVLRNFTSLVATLPAVAEVVNPSTLLPLAL